MQHNEQWTQQDTLGKPSFWREKNPAKIYPLYIEWKEQKFALQLGQIQGQFDVMDDSTSPRCEYTNTYDFSLISICLKQYYDLLQKCELPLEVRIVSWKNQMIKWMIIAWYIYTNQRCLFIRVSLFHKTRWLFVWVGT